MPADEQRARAGVGVRATLAALVVAAQHTVLGQYVRDSQLFEDLKAKRLIDLDEKLKNHPDLEYVHYPMKYAEPREFYTNNEDNEDYFVNTIFDPCREHGFGCCNDTFGTPEYLKLDRDPTSPTYGDFKRFRADGSVLPVDRSRWPDSYTVFDAHCRGILEPYDHCVGPFIARTDPSVTPTCWNYNDTIVADQPCRAPSDGTMLELCMEVGITSNAYVPECGGRYKNDPNCGVYLEIHKPGDPTILSEVKLRGQYLSGYRMAIISTAFQRDITRSLCRGEHELWWVHRTRHTWVVEARRPFGVISPQCDWNYDHNRYELWATLDENYKGPSLVQTDIFQPEALLWHATRTVGRPGRVGKGMGGTLEYPGPDEYNATTFFDFGTDYTYKYVPPQPVEDHLKHGDLFPAHQNFTDKYLLNDQGVFRIIAPHRPTTEQRSVGDTMRYMGPRFGDEAPPAPDPLDSLDRRQLSGEEAAEAGQVDNANGEEGEEGGRFAHVPVMGADADREGGHHIPGPLRRSSAELNIRYEAARKRRLGQLKTEVVQDGVDGFVDAGRAEFQGEVVDSEAAGDAVRLRQGNRRQNDEGAGSAVASED